MSPDVSFLLFLCSFVGSLVSIPAIRVYRAFWG